jgi:hypothetical protein
MLMEIMLIIVEIILVIGFGSIVFIQLRSYYHDDVYEKVPFLEIFRRKKI